MKRITPQSPQQLSLIPNFCSAQALLSMAFAMELTALCFTLANGPRGADALQTLLLLSLYLQWVGLCCGAVLCWLRGFLKVARPGVVFFVCWGAMVVIVMLLSDIAWSVGTSHLLGSILPEEEPRLEFVFRHTAVAAIVSLLLLRYFWIRHQWREQVRAEGESRYAALNARIRPHFFFNTLNSLAALIAIRPDDAERMVEDMAEVFRASLEKRGQIAPFADEIATCEAYLRIEQIRLGDKLQVHWEVPEALRRWIVPVLGLQPLIENAIHHGISRQRHGGLLSIRAWQEGELLLVEVRNPLPAPGSALEAGSRGNGIAIDNIASRLGLLYGSRGGLEVGPDQEQFVARLRIPREPLAQGEQE
ncbi:MAG TPA: histidine kinase [Nevskiaceae bacterium]|nr:histidine kinase [Nevskiaceae bacterium]